MLCKSSWYNIQLGSFEFVIDLYVFDPYIDVQKNMTLILRQTSQWAFFWLVYFNELSVISLTLLWRRPLSYRNQSETGFYMITASVMKELIFYFTTVLFSRRHKEIRRSFAITFKKKFCYLGFLSQTFTNHKTAGEREVYFFSLTPLTPASQTLRQ